MATNNLSNRGYRSSMRPEQLENRVMLSASPINVDADLAPAYHTSAHAAGWRADGLIDLAITGTEVQFSPIGTPAYMAGTVSYVMANGSSVAGVGLYQETLTPIFMDVNGDAMPDFVGTHGVATFSFYAGKLRDVLIGSITTVNMSFIQGMTATGELLVGSTGTITAATGLFKHVTGGFTSQSVVGLYPTFAMQTAVHFVIDDCGIDARFAAKVADAIATSIADAEQPKLQAKSVDAFHAGHDRDGDGKHDKPGKHGHSHDDHSSKRVEKVAKHDSHHGDSWKASRLDRWASDLAAHRRSAA